MNPTLDVEGLRTIFKSRTGGPPIRACDGVDLVIGPGEIVGLVGESGCGKSTLGRSIVGLERPAAGTIRFDGVDLSRLRGSELRARRRKIQYIFQDPYSSLSPRQTAGQAIDEALTICGERGRSARRARTRELLHQVGLSPHVADRYPRELSGGQRQRVNIARALAVGPKLLICDEPVSSLDVSIRAQVMNLLLKLQGEIGLSCLFISHDLAVVRQAAQRIYVMYLGKVVETGASDRIYRQPMHPYTQSLLSAIPDPDPNIERHRARVLLEGDLPSPASPPSGCRFRTRCPVAVPYCHDHVPELGAVAAGGHAACHFAGEVDVARDRSNPPVRSLRIPPPPVVRDGSGAARM